MYIFGTWLSLGPESTPALPIKRDWEDQVVQAWCSKLSTMGESLKEGSLKAERIIQKLFAISR